MPWAKLSDDAPSHPKMFRAGVEAFGLHVAALCWCNRHLTDGFVPVDAIPLLFPGTLPRRALKLIERLVAAGLWERVEAGWQIHDYLEYNASKAQIEAERQAVRGRKDRWKERRAERVRNDSGTRSERDTERVRNDAHARASTHPIPSHPNPPTPLATASPPNGFDQLPREAFNHDCPDTVNRHGRPVIWRGHCVNAAWAQQHPGQYPSGDEHGTPKQCPAHAALRT